MPASLGNPEKTALIALLLVDGEISTPELKKAHGVELRKETRLSLNEAGLITSRTEKTPHMHQITEEGEKRCEDVLAAMERPPRTSALLGVTFEALAVIVNYLRQHDIRLVDVVRSGGLEALIRAAYQQLKAKPQDFVPLAKLRSKLNGAGKDEVDKTLLAMTRTGLVHLAPDSDRRSLTEADHAAAIRIGKEDKHLVAIEES